MVSNSFNWIVAISVLIPIVNLQVPYYPYAPPAPPQIYAVRQPVPYPVPFPVPILVKQQNSEKTSTTTTTTTTTTERTIAVAVPVPIPVPLQYAVPALSPTGFCAQKPRPPNCPPCPPCLCFPSCTPAFFSFCSPCHMRCRCRDPRDAPIPMPPQPPVPYLGPAYGMPVAAPPPPVQSPSIVLVPFAPNRPHRKSFIQKATTPPPQALKGNGNGFNQKVNLQLPFSIPQQPGPPSCCIAMTCYNPCPYEMPMPYYPSMPDRPMVLPARTYFEPVIHNHPPLHKIKKIIKEDKKKMKNNGHNTDASCDISDTDTDTDTDTDSNTGTDTDADCTDTETDSSDTSTDTDSGSDVFYYDDTITIRKN